MVKNEKLSVLHVVHHFWPCVGDIEKVTESICSMLLAVGYRCEVACLNKCAYSKEELEKESKHLGIKIHRLPFLEQSSRMFIGAY